MTANNQSPLQPEIVDFVSIERDDDLIVSFAIRHGDGVMDIFGLTLLRMLRFEHLLPPEERGVSVSHGRVPEMDEMEQLVSLRWEGAEVLIETQSGYHFRLDVSAVDPEQQRIAIKTLHSMNFDHCFRLRAEPPSRAAFRA